MPSRFSHTSTRFSQIPLDVPGALFVSPMPYGKYDNERVFRRIRAEKINRAVVLLSDEEIRRRCSRDLKKLYRRHGIKLTQFPMIDFLQPGHARMDRLIPELVQALRDGERMVIHCHAGVGRSSLVVVCLCAVLCDMSVDEAFSFVKQRMETNITVEQKNFLGGWVGRLRENHPDQPVQIHSAEIIATGSELLQGRTLNTHGHHLGALLTAFGIPMLRETILPDDPALIRTVTSEALNRADLVIVTGGLGPTGDDRTREAVADAVGRAVVNHPEADAHLEAYFARMNRTPTPAQRRQSRIIDGAAVYLNPVGIAPGQRLTINNRKHLWLLPGPPRELRAIVDDAFQPWLNDAIQRPDRNTLVFRILGHSESRVEEAVRSAGIPAAAETAYCARPGSVELRFTGTHGETRAWSEWVHQTYAEDLLNETGDPIEVELGRILSARGETVATAESCTAGGIAERLTDVPGSSAWFQGGVIAYANEIKIRELNVDPDTLAREGAVSETVALQMAAGVRKRLQTTRGISITGIAGPGGGSPEKPVGLLWVGISGPRGEKAFRHQVNGNRNQIREHGIQRAMEGLWRVLRAEERVPAPDQSDSHGEAALES